MIDPRELRIGNLVQDVFGIGEVSCIPNKDLVSLLKDGNIFYRMSEEVNPIPITEEWLRRLGFVNRDSNVWYRDWIYVLLYDSGLTFVCGSRHVDFFYVHQLQNLYFALTGEELTLNQKV